MAFAMSNTRFVHAAFVDKGRAALMIRGMGRGGGNDPKLDYARLYSFAVALFPREIRMDADLNRRLKITSQVATNWKKRGVPRGEILSIADHLGVSVDLLRGAIEPGYEPEAEMTVDEAALVAAFRNADEETRRFMLTLARKAQDAASTQPHTKVVAPKKRR